MNKLVPITVTVLVALLGGSAQAGEIREEYDLDGVSEAQFQKDVAWCQGQPINDDDVTMAILAGPTTLLPHYRTRTCLAKKGYRFNTKSIAELNCEKGPGLWDATHRTCDFPPPAPRITDTPEQQAKAEATTFGQCQKAAGQWDGIARSCF